jgi:hypothetical protein
MLAAEGRGGGGVEDVIEARTGQVLVDARAPAAAGRKRCDADLAGGGRRCAARVRSACQSIGRSYGLGARR